MPSFFPDLHVKVAHEHLVKRTLCGSFVTLAFAGLTALLVMNEVSLWATTEVGEHLQVDAGVSVPLQLHLDVLFPAARCEDLRYGIADARGLTYKELKVEVEKLAWSPAGQGDALTEAQRQAAPGCAIVGSARVRKVAGIIEIDAISPYMEALMMSAMTGGRPPQGGGNERPINTTHTIRRLSFGPEFPGRVESLAGYSSAVEQGPTRYQYFLQAVPTVYESLRGYSTESHQYSATKFSTPIAPANLNNFDLLSGRGLNTPMSGITINFEFSPVMVRVVENKRTVLQFLTSICAIVGGVFTVAGMVDSTAHRTSEFLKKQA